MGPRAGGNNGICHGTGVRAERNRIEKGLRQLVTGDWRTFVIGLHGTTREKYDIMSSPSPAHYHE